MAEKLIGSLIYGEHAVPKKSKPWKDRLKVPVAIGAVLLVIGGVAYKFANYREEGRTREFVQSVMSGQYEAAYAMWDVQGNYLMEDFLTDWGKEGYYTKGTTSAEVVDSNTSGGVVVVYVALDTFKAPVALRVDKETLKLSFSPINKYRQ
jgi:hypothetical protein